MKYLLALDVIDNQEQVSQDRLNNFEVFVFNSLQEEGDAKNSVDNKNNIIIRQFTKQVVASDKFEKMEMIVGDFRIFTHRPGGMKIKQIYLYAVYHLLK